MGRPPKVSSALNKDGVPKKKPGRQPKLLHAGEAVEKIIKSGLGVRSSQRIKNNLIN